MKIDALGDKMKGFEGIETKRKINIGDAIIARLDGRSFHTFTKGLNRPYDSGFSGLMINTMIDLIEKSQPTIGYTQSDEITLIWYEPEGSLKEYPFGGRCQKLASTLAASATGYFNKNLEKFIPSKKDSIPTFDCRVYGVPTTKEAFEVLLWREKDAIKNSITMAALAQFEHKKIEGIGSTEKRQWLIDICKPWENMQEFFRRGTYAKRFTELRELTDTEMESIPEFYRPEGPVERSEVQIIQNLPYLEDIQRNTGPQQFAGSPWDKIIGAKNGCRITEMGR